MLIDLQHPNEYLVAQIHDVFDLFHTVFRKLGDVHKRPSLPGASSTKAPIGIMRTTLPRYTSPGRISLTIPMIMLFALAAATLSGVAINTRPSSSISILTPVSAMILLIVLPPEPMTSPDLIRVDRKLNDLGREGGKLRTRLAQHLVHLVQYEQSAAQRLRKGALQHILVDALDLDIHLYRGNALCGTGYLEIHIAQKIFQTLYIRQHDHFAIMLDKAHRRAGNGGF